MRALKTTRLNVIKNNLDTHGLTYLESNCVEISDILDLTCRARIADYPNNLIISTDLNEDVDLSKKNLSARQWKHLAESKINQHYGDCHKVGAG